MTDLKCKKPKPCEPTPTPKPEPCSPAFDLCVGETQVRLNDFNNRVMDELDGEHYEIFVVTNTNGTDRQEA